MNDKRQNKHSKQKSSYLQDQIDLFLNAKTTRDRWHIASRLSKINHHNYVLRLIDKRITESVGDIHTRLLILGYMVDRPYYLRKCLDSFAENGISLETVDLFNRIKSKPLSPQEGHQVALHIASCQNFDVRLFKYLPDENLAEALEGVLMQIQQHGLNSKRLQALNYDKKYLQKVQAEIRDSIKNDPESHKKWICYLDFSDIQNQTLVHEFYDIFQIFEQLRNKQSEYSESSILSLRVVQRLIRKLSIELDDWNEIKILVIQEINSDNIEKKKSIVNFLSASFYQDHAFSETMLISLYNKTTLYTRNVLDVLAFHGSIFAYREMVSILLSTSDHNEKFRSARLLVKFYPEKAKQIIEYVRSLGDEALLRQVNTDISLLPINDATNIANPIDFNTKLQLIPRSIQINELLFEIAQRIRADTLNIAVGFAFASGLQTISNVINYINQQKGTTEIIIGSLQNYNGASQNNKIDKNTVKLINKLIVDEKLRLFTYVNSFFHGKYYYIGNAQRAYVIIGSSNISKTAFFNNYELDVLISIDSPQEDTFANWFRDFRSECTSIPLLAENNFIDLKWNSELDVYTEKFVRKLSISEMQTAINELSDEEVKIRLLTWLQYGPSDCFTDLGIEALDGYVLFVYDEYSLGVFESFSRDNAYYVFNCISIEHLLAQVSQLSKTEMANISIFIGRGYHIENQDRLQDKIAKYFTKHI